MSGIFLDATVFRDAMEEEAIKFEIQQHCIRFAFPDGFTQLRLIEECRALNCLDITDPDNFDFMYDITMQMLTGKIMKILFIDAHGVEHKVDSFLITDRYMNLRSIPIIDEYPVLVNWLVEYIARYLSKKFPRSLQNIQATMSVRNERMKRNRSQ